MRFKLGLTAAATLKLGGFFVGEHQVDPIETTMNANSFENQLGEATKV
jgi:hypothetical protein